MSTEGSKSSGPFNVRTIKELVGLMSTHDLSEIDLRDGEQRVRLRRGGKEVVTLSTGPAPAGPQQQATVASPVAPAPAAVEPPKPTKNYLEIKSPTPGTCYIAPNPGADSFVKVGSKVTNSTVVCLIEAMKIFNEIQAECSGTIAEVLIQDKQPVEYGQVLFRVDPS